MAEVVGKLQHMAANPSLYSDDEKRELMAEAAERIMELEGKEFMERWRRIRAEALNGGHLEAVGSAHRSPDGRRWHLHDNNSVHMNDVAVYIVTRDGSEAP